MSLKYLFYMFVNSKKLTLALLVFFLTGCSGTPLKRSADNRLFDSKGFHQHKRRPLYNKKYITKALSNVKVTNYESFEDEDEEVLSPQARYIKMYQTMLEEKQSKKENDNNQATIHSSNKQEQSKSNDLIAARKSLDVIKGNNNKDELEKEIQEIKKLLAKTKEELVSLKNNDGSDNKNKDERYHKEQLRKEIDDELKGFSSKHIKKKQKEVKRTNKKSPKTKQGARNHKKKNK